MKWPSAVSLSTLLSRRTLATTVFVIGRHRVTLLAGAVVVTVTLVVLLFATLSRTHDIIASAGSELTAAVGGSSTGMSYQRCMSYVTDSNNGFPPWTMPDWKAMNAKPETAALIADAGGLTDVMRAFMRVYEENVWGVGSGGGSAPAFAARTICLLSHALPSLLNVTLLIDLPCGDQQWAPLLRHVTPGLKYIGVDVMPGLVQANRERYGKESAVEFHLMEMGTPGLFARLRARSSLWTAQDRVAVLSRHVLEHNTFPIAAKYIQELHASGAQYLIGTTALERMYPVNRGGIAAAGGYQAINFHAPPFSFPHGIFSWFETGQDAATGSTEMEVWEISSLPTQFEGV